MIINLCSITAITKSTKKPKHHNQLTACHCELLRIPNMRCMQIVMTLLAHCSPCRFSFLLIEIIIHAHVARQGIGHRTFPPHFLRLSPCVCVCLRCPVACFAVCVRSFNQLRPTYTCVCVCVCLSTLSESVRNGAYVQCKSFKSHTLIKRHSDTSLDWPASVEECVAFAVWHVSIVLTYTIGN